MDRNIEIEIDVVYIDHLIKGHESRRIEKAKKTFSLNHICINRSLDR